MAATGSTMKRMDVKVTSANWPRSSIAGLVREPRRLGVESRAQGLEQRIAGRVAATVREVERVVEVGGVLALGVLQDGLELVEALGQPSLGRGGGLVLVPQGHDVVPEGGGEWCSEPEQVGPLLPGLGRGGQLLRGGDITA